jgi:hypothetical protein
MTKIRIDATGYEAFDGFLGTLEFKGGVSVREATPLEIRRIGANVKIVEVEGNGQVGPSVSMVGTRHVSAQLETRLTRESEESPVEPETEVEYTEEKLKVIADEGGIKAVRKIAEKFGVKGVSISAMIEEIVAAQKAE